MTSEQLVAEGRKLARPCSFLRPQGFGPVVALWYERDDNNINATGHHCWLTVDAGCVPGLHPSITGYLNVFTDEKGDGDHKVVVSTSWPKRSGIQLYAHPVSVLPPLDAVFLRRSEKVGDWLEANKWERAWGYSSNFKDKQVAAGYQNIFFSEYPLYYESDVYAMIGGWHANFPDPDWQELIDDHLMIMTIRNSEPWIEAWRTKAGQFGVIERIT